MREIFEKLKEKIEAEGIAVELDDTTKDITLRIMPENIGPDADAMVVMELCRIPVDDEECDYFHFYTTIAKGLNPEFYGKNLLELNEMNLITLLGAYGILTDGDMLYHKHVSRISKCDDEKLVMDLLLTIVDIFGVIDMDYAKLLSVFAD